MEGMLEALTVAGVPAAGAGGTGLCVCAALVGNQSSGTGARVVTTLQFVYLGSTSHPHRFYRNTFPELTPARNAAHGQKHLQGGR